MKSWSRYRWLLLAGVGFLLAPEAAAQVQAGRSSCTVLVANGSGSRRRLSENIMAARDQLGLPLGVETIPWSRYGQVIPDHQDQQGHLLGGRATAQRVLALRQANPGLRLCLLGHSTGARVMLAAAESLPPGSVDHMVLLAPSVSHSYDLRPALRSCREGITSFYSQHDRFLGLAETFFTTAEGKKAPTAGRVGFLVDPHDPLYVRLRQFPWQPDDEASGHSGGHRGPTRSRFLAQAVLPLLGFWGRMKDEGGRMKD